LQRPLSGRLAGRDIVKSEVVSERLDYLVWACFGYFRILKMSSSPGCVGWRGDGGGIQPSRVGRGPPAHAGGQVQGSTGTAGGRGPRWWQGRCMCCKRPPCTVLPDRPGRFVDMYFVGLVWESRGAIRPLTEDFPNPSERYTSSSKPQTTHGPPVP
jgi:hypothetical protein